jgi:hypothetical protein
MAEHTIDKALDLISSCYMMTGFLLSNPLYLTGEETEGQRGPGSHQGHTENKWQKKDLNLRL